MKHLKPIFLLIFVCLIALTPAFADDDYSDDVDDSGVDRQKIYHIYEDIDLVPTVKIDYDKPRIVLRATFPFLTSENDNESIATFNQLVDDMIKDEMDDFKNQIKDKQSLQPSLSTSGTKNDLTVDFDTSVVNTTDKPIISIRFTIQGLIAGQAHPYHHHQVLNFNLADGQQIELADLFQPNSNYLEFLSNYSRDVLDKKLRDKNMIMAGTAPTPENYKNWNINPSGLLITFDEYQVAPYVYGTQTVLVPYTALKNMIAENSPIGHCLKHRRRCLQNNLLTGGFMDEA